MYMGGESHYSVSCAASRQDDEADVENLTNRHELCAVEITRTLRWREGHPSLAVRRFCVAVCLVGRSTWPVVDVLAAFSRRENRQRYQKYPIRVSEDHQGMRLAVESAAAKPMTQMNLTPSNFKGYTGPRIQNEAVMPRCGENCLFQTHILHQRLHLHSLKHVTFCTVIIVSKIRAHR